MPEPELPGPGGDVDVLRRFAEAVLEARDGFRANIGLYIWQAGEPSTGPLRAALCHGQVMAYREAAQILDEALSIATGQWSQGAT